MFKNLSIACQSYHDAKHVGVRYMYADIEQ